MKKPTGEEEEEGEGLEENLTTRFRWNPIHVMFYPRHRNSQETGKEAQRKGCTSH